MAKSTPHGDRARELGIYADRTILAARMWGAGALLQRACEALEVGDVATALEKARYAQLTAMSAPAALSWMLEAGEQ